jgi:S-adenosylmethionine hydrolase
MDSLTGRWHVRFGRSKCPLGEFYHAVPTARPVAVRGSAGFLEIAINGGNAAQTFGLKVGSPVWLEQKGLSNI